MWKTTLRITRKGTEIMTSIDSFSSSQRTTTCRPTVRHGVFSIIFFVAVFAGPFLLAAEKLDRHHNWPQWRGPLGTGTAPDADPPVEWSEESNIRWKAVLPGRGHSTPIVWGDRIFLTAAAAIGEELAPRFSGAPGAHDNLPVTRRHRFIVLAVDRRDGKIAWQQVVHESLPHEGGHYTGSLANASPVTDGELLFAYFGSHGLYCLTVDGKLVWEKDLGLMHSKHGHGEGSSPALFGEVLVVNWDHEGQSFVQNS